MKRLDDRSAALRRMVHVGKRELGLADDQYRDLLAGVTGKTSSTSLSVGELDQVIGRMKSMGFKVKHSTPKDGAAPRRVRTLDLSAEGRKVRALWLFMHTPLGLVRDSSEAALGAYVKRLAGVDALQWTDGEQITTVIESLKKWAMRALPAHVDGLRAELRNAIAAAGRAPSADEANSLAWGTRTYRQAWAAQDRLTAHLVALRADGGAQL